MKTTLRSALAFSMMLVGIFACFAYTPAKHTEKESQVTTSEKFAYSLYAVKQAIAFRLNYDNETGEAVSVKIIAPNGSVAYSEVIKGKKEIRRTYDLSAVGSGIYSVQISTAGFRTTQKVEVGSANQLKGEFKAYLSNKLNEGILTLAYENAGDEGANITIQDENGEVVYDENSPYELYTRKFNLSKLKKGNYKVRVASGKKIVEQTYQIQ